MERDIIPDSVYLVIVLGLLWVFCTIAWRGRKPLDRPESEQDEQ